MTWEYIAGFFDGEGSIATRGEKTITPHVGLCQSGREGEMVLTVIQDFLRNEEIKSDVRLDMSGGKLVRPMWRLRMTERNACIKFLRSVIPYLIVKKVKTQDWLRHFTIYPVGRTHNIRNKEAAGLRKGYNHWTAKEATKGICAACNKPYHTQTKGERSRFCSFICFSLYKEVAI